MSDPLERSPDLEFLREDYKHWTESYWENEKLGEQRVNFHLTVAVAVLTGVAAVLTLKDVDHVVGLRLARPALVGLLVLGTVTLLRVMRRNRMKEEYLHRMKLFRRRFAGSEFDLFYARVLPDESPLFRGGLTVLVSLMNGVVACILILLSVPCQMSEASLWAIGATSLLLTLLVQLAWVSWDESRTETVLAGHAGSSGRRAGDTAV